MKFAELLWGVCSGVNETNTRRDWVGLRELQVWGQNGFKLPRATATSTLNKYLLYDFLIMNFTVEHIVLK